ncbi:hypothetical protein [Magnetospirillum aberrantis]|uniref:Uncharacterized protein n=1 Tax=Magnetospirillum aberrantis SpK TaxID=908842 RepID=A0A7C9QW84_9PROT|nr:hypothetical protein [Magnetospirillum aberrantis]NFV80816.1 hypothetical protein [Magnetospirillum aberrantis SpK]
MATSAISAASSTDTQYPILINGYLCYSAAEVRAARQLINPRTIDKVTGLPVRESDTQSTSTRPSFMESLRGYSAQGTSDDETTRPRGSLLNILA